MGKRGSRITLNLLMKSRFFKNEERVCRVKRTSNYSEIGPFLASFIKITSEKNVQAVVSAFITWDALQRTALGIASGVPRNFPATEAAISNSPSSPSFLAPSFPAPAIRHSLSQSVSRHPLQLNGRNELRSANFFCPSFAAGTTTVIPPIR